MSFRIKGLPAEDFQHLFALPDEQLRTHQAVRSTVDQPHAYPCRVSLTDAVPGDQVVLVNYEHHPVDTPYRSSFAVYVREGEKTFDAVDEVPDQLRRRILAARGYDADGMLIEADLVEGRELEGKIAQLFADPRISYLQLHFAKPGCYAARVERA